MIAVRPAIPDDDAAICALSRRLYEEHPSVVPMTDAKVRASLHHFRARPDRGVAFVAVDDAAVVGFAFVATFWSNEYGGDAWILDELSVSPDRRGAGLGALLLSHVESAARAAHVTALMLELDDGNPAERLYVRAGWSHAKRCVYRKVL